MPGTVKGRWWSYGAFLAFCAVAGGVYFVRAEPHSFWEVVWLMVPWLMTSSAALGLVMVRRRGWMWWVAFALAHLALGTWVVLALLEWSPDNTPWREIYYIGCGSIVIAALYVSFVLTMRRLDCRGRRTKLARRGMLISATCVALAWAALVIAINTSGLDADWFYVPVIVTTIALTAAVLWFPAAQSLDELAVVAVDETLAPSQAALEGRCPRCGKPQRFARGTSKCAECGLHVIVEFEEPRCECGYLLYKLTGDVCPECGRRICANDGTARQTVVAASLSPQTISQR